MTKFTFRAATLAVLALGAVSTAAFAADSNARPGGHYEWQQVPQYGPRSTGPTQKRVWVPDTAQMADCDCDMMKMSAADCMMNMHKPKAPSVG
jgi:hypothetical protein